MGLFSRFEKKVPSTAEDPAAIQTAAHVDRDPEKHDIAQLEDGGEGRNEASYHVTPEMEKHVLRKLDMRLVPLVMGLCASSNTCLPRNTMLTVMQICWRIWIAQILGMPWAIPSKL